MCLFRYMAVILDRNRVVTVCRAGFPADLVMIYLDEENIDGVTVLHVRGSLMTAGLTAVEVRFDALASRNAVRAVVDIGQVEALTTPAITLMLRTARAIERDGGKIVFANPRPAVARMFATCRLDAILRFASDVDEAMKLVRSADANLFR